MKKIDFTKIYVSPNYGLETLVNGNVSECIRYYNELLQTGSVGLITVIEEMTIIKTINESMFHYILENLKMP